MSDDGRPLWQKRDWLMVLVYGVVAHAIFYPALQSNVFLGAPGRDTTGHDYGMLIFYWDQYLHHGRLALWNPYLFVGIPSLGTFAAYPFYPVTWLFAVLPFALAFSYQYIVNNWLGGLWTYWAGRWMGLGRLGAFFAGLVFMTSGHFVTLVHAGHLQKFAAIAWIPFVFGCATAAMRTRRWSWWAACGFGIGMQLLASHVQIAYYTIGFVGLWTLWTLWTGWTRWTEWTKARAGRIRAVGFGVAGLMVALVVAFGISAAQMLPAVSFTPISNRAGGVDFTVATETSYPPFEFIEYLLPSFLGDNTGKSIPYWGEWGTERIVTDYMGLLPILLFIFALAAGRSRDRWFWLGVVLVSAVLAVGDYTLVYDWAYEWVPGISHFRSPGTIMVFIAWPVAIVAGHGLDVFVERAAEPARRRLYIIVLATGALGIGILAFLLMAPELGLSLDVNPALAFLRRPRSAAASVYASIERSLLVGLLGCAALAFLAFGGKWVSKEKTTLAAWGTFGVGVFAVICVAFVDPWLHERRYVGALDARPFQIYLRHHWADPIIKELPDPVRGIEVGNEMSNRMMTRGIGSLHGYHPVYLRSYGDLMNLYAHDHPRLGRLVFEQFVLAPEGQSLGGEYERVMAEGNQALWFRKPPILYAYFPREIEVSTSPIGLLSQMGAPDFDPYDHSYTLDPALRYEQSEDSTASARVLKFTPDQIHLEVASNEARPMILAELAAPGWAAKVDSVGRALLLRANYAFRAVLVPEGRHLITLEYRPFAFRLGLYLMVFTVFLLTLGVVGFSGVGLGGKRYPEAET